MAQRITLSRARGWRKPDGAVVVARPTVWGNPWCVGSPGAVLAVDPVEPLSRRFGIERTMGVGVDALRAVQLFRQWLVWGVAFGPTGMTRLERDVFFDRMWSRREALIARMPDLRGRDLCCWCQPGAPCHADVLLEMANA